ncbi:hypothetical protein JAAARDRAFT_122430 [Jaapia argillacea MUCL 33604]|uniref:Uncharacterized protein n=1 Tax=Jaapia argillacea MUCL 33604 TaxID=933084 RepID=A0A067Q9K1_9AGAM|nr:hypothetical protein JAAARDRAFT_122430 [Jaapia argillacea MUCL 33604]
MPTTPTRLSAVFDKSLFVADPRSVRRLDQDIPEVSITREKSMDIDELTSSPLHVEPYPARKPSMDAATNLDSPARRHVEGVYDRFLMATSGVKRVGRGYQSDNNKPMLNVPEPASAVAGKRHQPSLFHSTRRPMPPPVSSEDWRKSVSVDELGMITNSGLASPDGQGEQGNNTMRIMRRALKAIVPGKVATRA